ncbi:protein of unknown function [Trichlorobacter ammonificans]|uniref:Uncharacterized protein n=1 Tax=Trichlorobacter ammonificans TaxID=2916410 RepID=A0ABM9D9G4_9BACT|nr:protein of unknown function [Trichlorobacter ammonificans]
MFMPQDARPCQWRVRAATSVDRDGTAVYSEAAVATLCTTEVKPCVRSSRQPPCFC